jgi:hypothetical protein
VIIGESTNKKLLDFMGIISSFMTNFKPSANGCKTPQKPTTFGPFRLCIDAITFRSAKVKKATTINKGIRVNNMNMKKSK